MSSAIQTTQDPARTAGAIVSRHPHWIAAILVAAGFIWRLWLAHATFFNSDEAWHYSLANQGRTYQTATGALPLPAGTDGDRSFRGWF
jgi:hypothetical protein